MIPWHAVVDSEEATVDRGFAVNIEMGVENMAGSTFVAKRMVCDLIHSFGGIKNIDGSNKQLLLNCASVWQKFMAHLQDERNEGA